MYFKYSPRLLCAVTLSALLVGCARGGEAIPAPSNTISQASEVSISASVAASEQQEYAPIVGELENEISPSSEEQAPDEQVLPEIEKIQITINDESGNPINNCRVLIYTGQTDNAEGRAEVYTFYSNADGLIVLDCTQDGNCPIQYGTYRFDLAVFKNGGVPDHRVDLSEQVKITVQTVKTGIVFVLKANLAQAENEISSGVKITITDESANAQQNLIIKMVSMADDAPAEAKSDPWGRTDRAGVVYFPDITAGDYYVTVAGNMGVHIATFELTVSDSSKRQDVEYEITASK